jgi:DNA-binding MarR family transcriptional regulator
VKNRFWYSKDLFWFRKDWFQFTEDRFMSDEIPREATLHSQIMNSQPPMSGRRVFAALGSSVRWKLMRELAGGESKSVRQLTTAVRGHRDAVSRHLQIMERAGLVVSQPGVDRRYVFYFVPEQFRRSAEELDFGCCKVKLSAW